MGLIHGNFLWASLVVQGPYVLQAGCPVFQELAEEGRCDDLDDAN